MVEFGLKLADNKVEEWGDHYVRYEKLKQILKKYEAQHKRFKELSKKDPEYASGLLRQSKEGKLPPTPGSSSSNPRDLKSAENSPTQLGKPPQSKYSPTESSLLFQKSETTNKNSNYGSQDHLNLSESTARSITRAMGVGSYFGYAWERQLRDILSHLKRLSAEFGKFLLEDIKSVNSFYNEKLAELEDRLKFLKETVVANHRRQAAKNNKRKPRAPELPDLDEEKVMKGDDVLINSPLLPAKHHDPHHKSTKSTMEFARTSLARIARMSDKNPLSNQMSFGSASAAAYLKIEEEQTDEDASQLHDEDENYNLKQKGEEKQKKIREVDSIERALVDQYRTAKLLHNFAIMNYTAFVKIVKKHDKVIQDEKGKFNEAIKPSEICDEGKAVEDYETRLETHFAVWFCGGNRSEARAHMLPKKGDSLEMDWSQLRLGYRLGMCTILGLWVCWDCIWGVMAEGTTSIGDRAAFPVFRAVGGLLTFQWFWGMSTWVWSRYRINYIYLFDFNPRIVESPLKHFNEAVNNTLFFLTSMLLYYKAGAHDMPGDIPPGFFPFLLVMYTLVQLILPLRTRVPMWLSIWKVVTAPLSSPSFYHGYVGDIFTSMVKVFQDLAWTVCFIVTGDWLISEDLPNSHRHRWDRSAIYKHFLIPLLTLLPLWFRFNQCLRRYADSGDRFPHLANAFKYALSQTVTLFGAFHPLYMDMHRHHESNTFQLFWMGIFIVSSLYSFTWDVYMDWGLGRPKYAFLGPRLMYPKTGFYYAIIALDLVLRFAWVLTLIPPDTGATFALPNYLTAVSMVLELYRRTVWGLLRLENEHRSNTQGYRRVGFVPLHFSTGHTHEYKQEKKHRGFSVLLEVAIITLVVICVSFGSVIAAQKATQAATQQSIIKEL